jgi:hypothetical protein
LKKKRGGGRKEIFPLQVPLFATSVGERGPGGELNMNYIDYTELW